MRVLMPMAFLLGVPIHVKTLIDNYIDLKMQAMKTSEEMLSSENIMEAVSSSNSSPDHVDIPVYLPRKQGVVYTKISPEDYDLVINTSKTWRMCHSGYPIFVKRRDGKFTTVYLHKLIFGGPARHINGDRLDNRRLNLIGSTKRQRQSRSDDDMDFTIRTPRVLCEEVKSFEQEDIELRKYTGFANISYEKGKKHYTGEIVMGKPDGYGHLYECDTFIQSCGMWKNGEMLKGMVMEYKPLPNCICQEWKQCPFREVVKLDIVTRGKRCRDL